MLKSVHFRFLLVFCVALALTTAACGDDDSPVAPTPMPEPQPEPEPELVTIDGNWHGSFEGTLGGIELHMDDVHMMLQQDGMDVTGDWEAPMPEPLVAVGAPAEVPLAGPVTGMVEEADETDGTAELTLSFLEAFHLYFGGPDCALHVHVESFTEEDLEGHVHTTEACPENVTGEGELDMHKDEHEH